MRKSGSALALASIAVALGCGGHANVPRTPVFSDLRYAVDASHGTTITVTATFDTTGADVVELPDDMSPTLVSFAVERGGAWVGLPLRDTFDVPRVPHPTAASATRSISRAPIAAWTP